MSKTNKWNVVLLVTDGHGRFTGNMDWGTKEFYGRKDRMDGLKLQENGFVSFTNATSPAVSTIMSIESIMSGVYAAKSHKLHWRQWPTWDKFRNPVLSDFLKQHGYEVNGFSYLLNSENWLPCVHCYKPELYKNYPSKKKDTHSHQAVMETMKHFFKNEFKSQHSNLLIVHSIFIHDMWNEMMGLFEDNGITQDNTIFVMTADHYFPKNFGRLAMFLEREHLSPLHHVDLTEYNTAVPLYLRYPGSKAMEISDSVSGYDIAPTIVDMLGLTDKWPAKFDGQSLIPYLNGESGPAKMNRTDSLYPYQIGEKQGRITSIHKGRYKYIFKPDPPSSYIAYRMSENWDTVLEKEEFYDIEVDPEEKNNLIYEKTGDIQKEIAKCRNFLKKTNEDIINYHVETLMKTWDDNEITKKLFQDKENASILCVQSCPDIVFRSIIEVIRKQLPDCNIDVVIKKDNSENFDDMREEIVYPSNAVYQRELFLNTLGKKAHDFYDCIINTSNVPIGDYLAIYDQMYHPVGDFRVSREIISCLNVNIKASLCLDMTYEKIHPNNAKTKKLTAEIINIKRIMKITARSLIKVIRPWLMKIRKAVENEGPKINKSLSERIITKDYKKCQDKR